MTTQELRKLSMDKLQAELQTAVEQYSQNYRTHSAGELANPTVLKINRRDIARVKTVMSEKRREEKAEPKAEVKESSNV